MDISILYNKCGDLCAGLENISFYQKRNLITLYNDIHETTSFLNNYNVSMKERIFYIKNNLLNLQQCIYCNINKLTYHTNTKSLSVTCGNDDCIKKSKLRYRDTSHLYVYKTCNCGSQYKVSKKSGLSKQYCSRKCYVKFKQYTHSVYTIEKIRISNKKTHNDPKWRESKKDIYDQSHKKISATMKKKISEGSFTPCITNSWTKWSAYVNINNQCRKFRSFWEASFFVLNTNLEFEKIRIPYTYNNQIHSYIVDFVDMTNKILYEIKPNSTKTNELNQIKFSAAHDWAKINGYSFKIISDDWFKQNAKTIDYTNHPQLYSSMKQFL